MAASTTSSQACLASGDSWARAARTATSSVQSRCATWVATVQPGAGVCAGPAVGAEPLDGRPELVALGGEVVQQAGQEVGHDAARARSRVVAHWSRMRRATPPVVGDGVGQAQAADQVQGGLHELAHAGAGLVGAEQVDGHPVRLAADLLLERRDLGQQRFVGARGHPQLQRGGEHRRGEVVAQHRQHRAGAAGAGGQPLGRGGQLGAADLGDVLHRGHHEVLLGREVVQLGAPADAGPLADQRGRRAGVTPLDEQLDGRLEQPRPHRAGALLLRHARRRCLAGHRFRMRGPPTNSQD